MSKRFGPGSDAKPVDANALGQAMSGMRGGFSITDAGSFAKGEPEGPVGFSPAPPPKHFSPADPSANPTAGWDPFDPLGEKARVGSAQGDVLDPISTARAEGYADGVAAAVADMASAARQDSDAIEKLTTVLARMAGFDRDALAANLRQTVLHLVTRIVGECGISPDLLHVRIAAAVDLLADTAEPALMRLNPADLALIEDNLPARVFAVGDKAVERGAFVIETKTRVIEDGPAAWLAQLTAVIDRAALPDTQ